MAVTGFGVWALVGQQLATAFFGTTFLWLVSPYRPGLRFSKRHLMELLGVGSPVFANTLIWFFTSRLDQLVIGRYAGASVLGVYVVGGKAPELAKLAIQQPLADIALPALSKVQHDRERLRQSLYRGMALNSTVMFAAFVGLAAVAGDLVPLLFGPQWADAAILCSLISIYSLVNALQVFSFPALLTSGLSHHYAILGLANAIGVFATAVVGIQFGVVYLAAGLILNSLLQSIPIILLLKRRIGLDPKQYCKPCLVPAAASLIMASIVCLSTVTLTREFSPWLRLAVNITLGASIYLAFMQFFARSTVSEIGRMALVAIRGGAEQPNNI
jgi:PST family polysaccharide transporter